jgi:hypothetical protein
MRADVQGKVKAIVQVAGMHSIVRIDPNNETRRAWFRKASSFPDAYGAGRARSRADGLVR